MIYQGSFTHYELPESAGITENTLQEGYREYITPDGTFPSVSTVTGFEKKEFFEKWRREHPMESDRTSRRGTRYHATIEQYLLNQPIDTDAMTKADADLFRLALPFLARVDNIRGLEVPMWSKTIGLAGRTDCIAEYDHVPSIIDWKAFTRAKYRKDMLGYFWQATAYSIMADERYGWGDIQQVVVATVAEDGTSRVYVEKAIDHVAGLFQVIQRFNRKFRNG